MGRPGRAVRGGVAGRTGRLVKHHKPSFPSRSEAPLCSGLTDTLNIVDFAVCDLVCLRLVPVLYVFQLFVQLQT